MTKTWTNPFEKSDFSDFLETLSIWSKTYSFQSGILKKDLLCLGKNGKEHDFLTKTWTNPFEKSDFSDFFETLSIWSKKYSSQSGILKKKLFCLGKNSEEHEFLTKTWTKPFEKSNFSDVLETLLF